jgi:hypothetical protein
MLVRIKNLENGWAAWLVKLLIWIERLDTRHMNKKDKRGKNPYIKRI